MSYWQATLRDAANTIENDYYTLSHFLRGAADVVADLESQLADARLALRAGQVKAWRLLSEPDKQRVEAAEAAKNRLEVAQVQLARAEARIRELESKLAAVVKIVERTEWSGRKQLPASCPWCLVRNSDPHRMRCMIGELKAALAAKGGGDDQRQ